MNRLEFSDNASEDPDSKISNLFDDIEEKQCELGSLQRTAKDSSKSVSQARDRSQNFTESENLRKSATHRTVHIQPDRSPEEWSKQGKLVAEMRRRASEDLDSYFFIFRGKYVIEIGI